MLVVETVVRIRREHAGGKPIKEIARDLRLSRKVIRKAIRAPEGAFDYHRSVQPLPRIGPFQERLDTLLAENEARSRRDRLRMTRIHDLLLREGFEGSYDAVRRYATRWAEARRKDPGVGVAAFIPLLFRQGEAYQFDWSHEDVEIAGKPMRVKVAHVRLCASRAMYVRAYPRETQEMLFDAHARAFAFFGGVPTRGIYDNMKTAVTTVFTGKDRLFNRRFLVMASHYMVEPTACSPAAGWEKGQVEHQVQTARGRFFQPRLRFTSLEELNGWLEAECRRWGELRQHPEQKELTVAQALAAERSALQPMLGPFDGFHESEHAVTGTCLISFDRNRYSVMAKAGRRTVQVRAYADRIVVRLGADIGIAHDGDADRCLAVDASCTVVDGDELLAICALALRDAGSLREDTVVATSPVVLEQRANGRRLVAGLPAQPFQRVRGAGFAAATKFGHHHLHRRIEIGEQFQQKIR